MPRRLCGFVQSPEALVRPRDEPRQWQGDDEPASDSEGEHENRVKVKVRVKMRAMRWTGQSRKLQTAGRSLALLKQRK